MQKKYIRWTHLLIECNLQDHYIIFFSGKSSFCSSSCYAVIRTCNKYNDQDYDPCNRKHFAHIRMSVSQKQVFTYHTHASLKKKTYMYQALYNPASIQNIVKSLKQICHPTTTISWLDESAYFKIFFIVLQILCITFQFPFC